MPVLLSRSPIAILATGLDRPERAAISARFTSSFRHGDALRYAPAWTQPRLVGRSQLPAWRGGCQDALQGRHHPSLGPTSNGRWGRDVRNAAVRVAEGPDVGSEQEVAWLGLLGSGAVGRPGRFNSRAFHHVNLRFSVRTGTRRSCTDGSDGDRFSVF